MVTYLHIMDGTSVEASCEVDTRATSYGSALDQLVEEAFGIFFGRGFRIEFMSKFDPETKQRALYDILVLDGELDYKKSWGEDAIEESGFKKVQLSSHIFDGYSKFALLDLEEQQEAA